VRGEQRFAWECAAYAQGVDDRADAGHLGHDVAGAAIERWG
jgi:hypothetical protein